MKNSIFIMALLSILFVTAAEAKKKPQIQFEQTTIDLGTFSDPTQVHKVVFKFKNVGKAKLVINYVNTSCGCTVAEYPKDFISPGGTGEIKVSYDPKGKFPGPFRKGITVFTNSGKDTTRLFITGKMVAPQQTK